VELQRVDDIGSPKAIIEKGGNFITQKAYIYTLMKKDSRGVQRDIQFNNSSDINRLQ